MSNFVLARVLILLFLAPTVFAQKPTVVYILLDSHDDSIVKENRNQIQKLKGCGFEIKEIQSPNLETIRSQLESLEISKDTPLFIDGHGTGISSEGKDIFQAARGIESSGEFFFAAREQANGEVKPLFPGRSLMNNISKKFNHANVWIDTCHADFCEPCEGLGMGAVCQADMMAFNDNPSRNLLSDLMCASLNNCEKWYEADKDKNGIVTSAELNHYFKEKLGSKAYSKEKTFSSSELEAPDGKKKLERFRKTCDRYHGKIEQIKLGRSFTLAVRELDPDYNKTFQCEYELPELNSELSYYYHSDTEAIEALKKLYAGFPSGEHLSPFNRKMSEMRLKSDGEDKIQFRCNVVGPYKQYDEASGKTDRPVAGTFTIYSPSCGNKNGKSDRHVTQKSNGVEFEPHDSKP